MKTNINKEILKKVEAIESKLDALNDKPIKGEILETDTKNIHDIRDHINMVEDKVDNLIGLLKEVLSAKNEQIPQLKGFKFLWSKFFHSSDS